MNAPLFTLAVILVVALVGGAIWAAFTDHRKLKREEAAREAEARRHIEERRVPRYASVPETGAQRSKPVLRIVALLLVAVALSSCGWFDRGVASWTGYSRLCIDGVSYLQFTSGATVEWTPEGKVRTCK